MTTPNSSSDLSPKTVGSSLEEQRIVAERAGESSFPAGYQQREEVGRGGMGVVVRAREAALDRDVAVKLLLPDFATDSLTAARFLEEARITAQLQHPGIPPVHCVGTLPNGRPFIVMKLIKGKTLKVLLEEGVERGRFLAIFEAVAQAVAYAHQHRVIHRDLKPGNVMVGSFGEVQVMDWGLAKVLPAVGASTAEAPAAPREWETLIVSPRSAEGHATEDGSVQGTPAYMPPEQAGGELHRIGPRSDVFALGALLCCGLTGQPIYTGRTVREVHLKAVRTQTDEALARLDACGADPELGALIRRCLVADPDARPAHAGEVVGALADWHAAADARARRAEKERADKAVAEAARDRAKQLYVTALGAFNRTVFNVQERLEARPDAGDLQRELFAAARAGLDLLLREAEGAETPDEGGVGAVRLSGTLTGDTLGADATTETGTGDQPGEEFEQFGDQLQKLGLIDEALRAYTKSLALKQRLVDADPTRPELQLGLLGCYKRLAALELNRGAAGAAREFCTHARVIAQGYADHPLFVGEQSVIEALLDLCREVEGSR